MTSERRTDDATAALAEQGREKWGRIEGVECKKALKSLKLGK